MRYSYLWLKEYVPQIPEPKKLVGLLTMRAFEVEEVDVIGGDSILDIKVLPNRAFDCLSHIGMAREIGAISSSKLKAQSSKAKEDKNLKIKDFLQIEVQDKKLCPRYSARVAVDVKVGESPKWMQNRLIACGLRPINNIVDIANYVMLETGQPLHAFDFSKIESVNPKSKTQNPKLQSKKIIVRRAKAGEKIVTLDGEKKELDENILVIADAKEPIAIAGIKGGKKAEIDKKTARIILESANFEPVSTRKSSKALNLRTDASIRFENGVDINLTIQALDRAAQLISEIAGGKIMSGIVDVLSAEPKQTTTAVAHSYVEKLLGISIKETDILDIFKRLDLPVKKTKKKNEVYYDVLVPSRRNDLNTSEDLIEEVGRLYGYENIPAKMPVSILVPAVKNEELMNEEKAKNIMVGAGYSEVSNYSLISEEGKSVFGLDNLIGPRYPLSQDQKYLRPTLIIRLFGNIKENLKRSGDIRIFEIGKVFILEGEKIEEKRMIGGALSRRNKKTEEVFYEMKGVVDLLLEKMGVPNFSYGQTVSRQAKVIAGSKDIGWIGEIDKKLTGDVVPMVFFEMDFDVINEIVEEEIEYRAPSKYPAIERDLSVVVPQEVKVDDVLNVIENASGPLVINIDLLDIYDGEEMEEGMKSMTFGLVFQSYEKTLTDAEVNKIMEKVIKAIEEKDWEIRK
jgi:phenylalanyl-tRNA synthetase beta chain